MSNLIFSNVTFFKDGKPYSAALDYVDGRVKVFARNAVGNRLSEHYFSTLENSEGLATVVRDALAYHAPDYEEVRPSVRTFVYMPTSRCNMGCTYCGQAHSDWNASVDVNRLFLQRVLLAVNDPDVEHVHLSWFGGEPLLAYRTIAELSDAIINEVDRCSKRYSSKMTTNGALLTPGRMKDLVEKYRVSRFDITIDGLADVHDKHRPLKGGGGSFSKIIRLLEWFNSTKLSPEPVMVLRTNVDRNNLFHVREYIKEMQKRGFVSERKFLYEISPVHSWGNDLSQTLIPAVEAADLEIQWMELMESLGLPFGLLPSRVGDFTCVATDLGSEVVGPDGTVYSCTETPLTKDGEGDSLGKLSELKLSELRSPGQYQGWDAAVEGGSLPCSTCGLRPICRGACPKQWAEGNVACPTLKLNFDGRIKILMARYGYYSI